MQANFSIILALSILFWSLRKNRNIQNFFVGSVKYELQILCDLITYKWHGVFENKNDNGS